MNNTRIEWCDSTWNPVTGCLHDCEYCYARKIATRFGQYPCENSNCNVCGDCDLEPSSNCERYIKYEKIHELEEPIYLYNPKRKQPYPYMFEPTFHKYRLEEPKKKTKGQNIFVCSMADLFGEWVPDEWIKQILETCKMTPQHNYLFLTKNFERYENLNDDCQNLWYGATATDKNSFTLSLDSFMQQRVNAERFFNTFLSIEPLLEEININKCDGYFSCLNWVILGAETGNRKDRVIPKKEWIDIIVEQCKRSSIPVYMKDSLINIVGEENMLREYPNELKENK